MILKKNAKNLRAPLTVFAMFALAVAILWFGANNSKIKAASNGDAANSPEATFAGTGVGAIPDTTTSGTFGAPLVVSFAVTGVTGNVTDVSLDVTMTHTWIGDLEVILTSPGGTRSLVIFSRVGATTDIGGGDSSNLGGTYTFSDAATGTNIWTVATAAACTTDCVVAPGTYRTTAAGGVQTNPAPVTSLNTTFGGLTPAQANGTWTLTFRDRGAADVGSVTAANLTLNPTGVVRGTLFDFTGSGRTSFVTLALPVNGLITWKIAANPALPGPNNAFIRKFDFGRVGDNSSFGDTIVANDYIGDLKTEVAVYRDTDSTYYLAQTPTGTGGVTLARAQPWGNGATDTAGGEGDYDGDGKADFTVVRVPATSLIWYILSSSTNTMKAITFGDITAATVEPSIFPGADFNGDGRDELIYVYHNAAGTAVTYNIGDANTGAGVLTRTFGNFNTDYSVAPDDYTGDGRADFVAIRATGAGPNLIWYVNNTATNVITATTFGVGGFSATTSDRPVRGDYDGDGRHDIAVWRPSNQTFYWINSSNGSLQSQQFGDAGDRPLGSFGLY